MTHQETPTIPMVRVPAATRLRTCSCGGRMYWISTEVKQGTWKPVVDGKRTFFCDDCKRVEVA